MRRSAAVVALAVASLLPAAPAVAHPRPVTHDEQIAFHRWESLPQWRGGTAEGTRAVPGRTPYLTIDRPAGAADGWEYATWTSPVRRIGFGASELVASWNAATPAGTWIQVDLEGTYTD